ncbi:hypothetical protein [Streptosporangium sp. CA-115845]|uniref:hypothetical protein n=1 Tax=Streptosporangium sp. CA-115845 TaxID=3240071 RepID=UPI003D936867
MSESRTVPPGRPWPILLPGQAAIFGLAVFLLDRAASGTITEKAAVTVRVTEDVRAELVRYGESAVVGWASGFFLAAVVFLVPVAVLLQRDSRRAAAAGLIAMGLLTPPYLAGLAVVAFTTDPVSGLQASFIRIAKSLAGLKQEKLTDIKPTSLVGRTSTALQSYRTELSVDGDGKIDYFLLTSGRTGSG